MSRESELSNNPGELPAPDAGEDEALLNWTNARHMRTGKPMLGLVQAGDALTARIRALLADVARLEKEAGIARAVKQMNNEAHYATINKLNAALARAEQTHRRSQPTTLDTPATLRFPLIRARKLTPLLAVRSSTVAALRSPLLRARNTAQSLRDATTPAQVPWTSPTAAACPQRHGINLAH